MVIGKIKHQCQYEKEIFTLRQKRFTPIFF